MNRLSWIHRPFVFSLILFGYVYEKIQLTVQSIDCQEVRASLQNSVEMSFPSNEKKNDLLVQYGDSIYLKGAWDSSPIIVEKYKLVFFSIPKVGCTVWKQLFRRIEGFSNWKAFGTEINLPYNPEANGLKYLYDYDRETASRMIQDPEWTKAVFVRDPKVRFVSAYLDKVINTDFFLKKCCPYSKTCLKAARKSIHVFFDMIHFCFDGHWQPMSKRILEVKYWPYINFVGHLEKINEDSERLLRQLGAWDEYGATGWGENDTDAIFRSFSGSIKHVTNATDKLQSILSKDLEQKLEIFYAADYNNSYLNLTKIRYSEFV